MANELNYYGKLNETGLTVVARVYDASGTQVGSDISCSESGSLAIYTGDMPTTGAGEYGVRFFDGSTLLGQGFIEWDGTAERFPANQAELHARMDAYSNKGDWQADVSSLATSAEITALNDISASDVWAVATRTLSSYPDATLSSATLSNIAEAVEQAILNEGDGEAVLNAIVGAIGNQNIDQIALVASIRADLERAGGAIKLIEADTNELQGNQANWNTATGFSTPANVTSAQTAIQTDIGNLNDVSPAEVNAEVDSALADYDAPTKAELDATETAITNAIPDTSGLATQTSVDAIETKTEADTRQTALLNAMDTDEMTEAELHSALDSYGNKDDWKADLSTISLDMADITTLAKESPEWGTTSDPDFDTTFQEYSTFNAGNLFDGDYDTLAGYPSNAEFNIGARNVEAQIRFDAGSEKVVLGYSLTCGDDPSLAPLSWQILSSSASATGGVVDTQTNITWEANETKTFVFASPVTTRRFSYNTTALQAGNTGSGSSLRLRGLDLLGAQKSMDQLFTEHDATQALIETVDANVDAILVDTDELQTNQGDWATATGFATPTDVSDAQTAIITEVDANETKIDSIVASITAGLTLTPAERTAIANTVEAVFLADTVATDEFLDVLRAKLDDLDFSSTDITAIVAQIERSGGLLQGTKDAVDAIDVPTEAEVATAVWGDTSTYTAGSKGAQVSTIHKIIKWLRDLL